MVDDVIRILSDSTIISETKFCIGISSTLSPEQSNDLIEKFPMTFEYSCISPKIFSFLSDSMICSNVVFPYTHLASILGLKFS